jgi:hypothetical protein
VPPRLAEFFIESFASDEPQAQLHVSPKQFPTHGRLLKFRVPALLPVIVNGEAASLTFGFFDTPLLAASETERIFKRLLTVLSQRPVLAACFARVDSRGFSPDDIDTFATDLDVRVLVEYGRLDRELDARDVTISVMKSHWDAAIDAVVRPGLREMWNLRYFRKCGLVLAPGDGEGCVTREHRGERIRFDNGQWDLVEFEFEDGDDEGVTFVRWSCCDDVRADAPGCISVPAGAHEADAARPYSSEAGTTLDGPKLVGSFVNTIVRVVEGL